ncbi:pyridoxamine 5'-phosphate oxidase family protein [Microbulbifer agarilyticus]|uniref:pyridoxamine 5'-phosphate oxidase family protein n=1 Tax=Microbulbifer agarilyticus TaxID=260552 RepID=UPI0021BC087C|nr:pyridoxamine 5'-phosphate oxidase family protein [Microbulbifer agarilyticus]
MSNDMQGYEDVTIYGLSQERENELLNKQIECNFIWTNKEGHGLGVIMNYIAKNGSIWVTATSQRPRVKALRRDPRASVVISSMGTDMGPGKTVTYKGRVKIHEDQATKDWFYPAMAKIISPYPAPTEEAAIAHLDTPLRVIIELIPEKTIKFDGDSIAKSSHEGTIPGASS